LLAELMTIFLDSFGGRSSPMSSLVHKSARYCTPFALRRAARTFALCERVGSVKAHWRGNQGLRFRRCTLRA
jgi:hypothetical protein